jgi:uncharacterized membrane protein
MRKNLNDILVYFGVWNSNDIMFLKRKRKNWVIEFNSLHFFIIFNQLRWILRGTITDIA